MHFTASYRIFSTHRSAAKRLVGSSLGEREERKRKRRDVSGVPMRQVLRLGAFLYNLKKRT